jgi:YHS domain-containing protein
MKILTRRLLLALVPAAIVAVPAFQSHAGEVFVDDGVAIKGYDPVAYFAQNKPVEGSKAFTAMHMGATFRFSSAANRDAFLASPERYAPQYGGFCAYAASRGYKAKTEPDVFAIVNDKLYLNYDENVGKTWSADAHGYIRDADAKWDTVKKKSWP